MMPNCDIEELKKENKKLKERVDFLETSFDFDIGRLQEEVKILKNKLLEVKPELKEWLEKNFKGV